jgi:L-asparaginase
MASVDVGDGEAATPKLSAQDLVAELPDLACSAEVTARSLCQVSSASLSVLSLLDLFSEIRKSFDEGAAAVVVTQGTDTLEETSFALDLIHAGPEPIVFTGAMRPASSPGRDGPANLLAALQVAASPAARGIGVVTVMADEIHSARWVTKRHTSRVAAFDSPLTGPIGWVSEGQVRIANRPASRPTLSPPIPAALQPVATVALGIGDDGCLLPSLPGMGYAGLVIEAMGGGHVPADAVDAVAKVAAEIPVVVSSRTGAGELLKRTYGFPGSETDLLSLGVISAGILIPSKARLLLMFLLANCDASDDVREVFSRYAMPFDAQQGCECTGRA